METNKYENTNKLTNHMNKKIVNTQNYYKYLNGTQQQNQHTTEAGDKTFQAGTILTKKEYLCALTIDAVS